MKNFLLSTALLLASGVAFAGPVNINTADAKTLAKELTGIGPARAEAIVQYRTEKGPFASPEEITKVRGVGEAVYKENLANIQVK